MRATCKIAGCEDVVKGHGWCSRHWQRWRNFGDPLAGGREKRRRGEWVALLREAAVATTDRCIIHEGWTGRPNVQIGSKQMWASRAVWIFAHGDPGPLSVLHKCNQGVQGCVNIRHLYLGTQAQNCDDMRVAGTRKGIAPFRGSDTPAAKLTEAQVLEIRARWAAGTDTQVALSVEFGVANPTINKLLQRKSWTHI